MNFNQILNIFQIYNRFHLSIFFNQILIIWNVQIDRISHYDIKQTKIVMKKLKLRNQN